MRELRKLVDEMYRRARPIVEQAAGGREDNESPRSRNPFTLLHRKLSVVFGDVVADPRAPSDVAGQLNAFNRRQHERTMNVVKGLQPLRSEPWIAPVMEAFQRVNHNLIASLAPRAVSDVQRVLSEGWERGLSTRDLLRVLDERHGVTGWQAERIARDQVGKMNGLLTALRQTASGVERYRWRTSRDPRVRELHAQREGDVFSWDQPPSDGHPGMPIMCRCGAQPVMDDLLSEEGLLAIGTPGHAERVQEGMRRAVGSMLEGGGENGGFDGGQVDLFDQPSMAEIAAGLASMIAESRGIRRVRAPRTQAARQPRAPRKVQASAMSLPGRMGPVPPGQEPPLTPEEAAVADSVRAALLSEFGVTWGRIGRASPYATLKTPEALQFVRTIETSYDPRGHLAVAQATLRQLRMLKAKGINVPPFALADMAIPARSSESNAVAYAIKIPGPGGMVWRGMAVNPRVRSGDFARWKNGEPAYAFALADDQDVHEYVVRHEIGHLLERGTINSRVSRRARDEREAFAEAFAAVHGPGFSNKWALAKLSPKELALLYARADPRRPGGD